MDITRRHAPRRTARLAPLAVGAILTALALTGCGSAVNASADGSATSDAPAGNAVAPSATTQALEAAGPARVSGNGSDADPAVQQRAVISTGDIALISSDVTAARTRLDAVLARAGGRVADERTLTDDHGTVTSSHLVVRVPSSRFDRAMTALAQIASLRSSTRQAQDVTTKVIDIKARIKAEQAGVGRLRQLVSHTASLGALLAVERALTQRQGELESLQQQRAYLADQTGEATITVDVSRRSTPPPPPKAAAGGFVGGLKHGWHGLVTVVDGFLVGLGAALPFGVLAALLGIPAFLVVRRLRTRRQATPAES
jgi:hypothetical protein